MHFTCICIICVQICIYAQSLCIFLSRSVQFSAVRLAFWLTLVVFFVFYKFFGISFLLYHHFGHNALVDVFATFQLLTLASILFHFIFIFFIFFHKFLLRAFFSFPLTFVLAFVQFVRLILWLPHFMLISLLAFLLQWLRLQLKYVHDLI